MTATTRLRVLGSTVALTILACASPQAPALPDAATARTGAAPKRIVASIMGEPPNMASSRTNPTLGSVPGMDVVDELVNDGLTTYNAQGIRVPLLAESVPTIENGLWRVLPDGTMEITWTIRPDARWQDGVPLSTEDLVFTARFDQDRELGIPRNNVYNYVQSVDPVDARTVVVRWSGLFIEADSLFTAEAGLPLPRHILEAPYLEDKATVLQHPYWTDEFVGTGAYLMRRWVPGEYMVLAANPAYHAGRPRIDEIEVRFIRDVNALIANLLAGSVELTMGRGLDPEHVVQIREHRRDVQALLTPFSWLPIRPQFVNPNPPIILDPRFRRAVVHAIDRQALVDTIQHGMVEVAHSMVHPSEPDYPLIEPGVVKYAYDPRLAGQMIAELGYQRGADGYFTDAGGQRLTVEVRTTAQRDQQVKATFAVADNLQRIGVNAEVYNVPLQLIPDREHRANFPGFEIVGGGAGLAASEVRRYHSSSAPLPENGYRATGNNARYMNPEFDALIERYLTTIPRQERMGWMREIVHHQTDLVTVMGLFYQIRPTIVSPRIMNVTATTGRGTIAWNAREWDVKRPE